MGEKANCPRKPYVPPRGALDSIEDVQIPGDLCPLCYPDKENPSGDVDLLKFTLGWKFDESGGNRFGVLVGLVASDFEVYWRDVVLRRKSPISLLGVEVEIPDRHDETATKYGPLYRPK